MSFSTQTITDENAAFAEFQQIGTATELCRHTGEVLNENVHIFIAVMPKVPDDEIPTIDTPNWKQESYIKEVHRLDELRYIMRQNAGIGDLDSLWMVEKISDIAVDDIFKTLEHWERAFEVADTLEADHRAIRLTNIKRL